MSEERAEQILVGRVDGAYGVKGWVKVFSFTDPMEGILAYSPWQVAKRGKQQTLAVVDGHKQGRGLVALLEGYEDRSQAESLTGAEIRITGDQLPVLEEGEFYWHELEGLAVVNKQGERLGRVDHLMETGANDVMAVKPDATSIDDRDRLIPYVADRVIVEVDTGKQEILVDWPADF